MSEPSIPGYENFTLIGKGGFSRVYSAEQATLKRQVAVKVLNFGLSDDADRRSFERETELMGRVSTHPNIVTVHATAFSSEGRPCIIMEHYPGGSLAQMIGTHGLLQADEVLEVGVAIASALDGSHRAGILHCDLKPQNIMVSEFGQPALGDFGISTFTEERTRTATGAVAGFTLAYAAPEIIEGASPSVASDLYSLAATLYTLLCGRRPFSDSPPGEKKPSTAEQARRILLEEVPSLVDKGIAPEIDRVIRSAMAKEPENRPESATDFAAALYQVGQRLGFGTSAPRTGGGSGLRMPDVAFAETSEIENAPAIDFTRQREPADLLPDEQPVVEPALVDHAAVDHAAVAPASAAAEAPSAAPAPSVAATPSARSRTVQAALFAFVSLAVVGGVLFLANRSDTAADGRVAVATAVPTAPRTPVSDPVIVPSRPSNVQLASLDDSSAVVWWDPSEDRGTDVTYEVRRQGASDIDPVVTTDGLAVIPDLDLGRSVCVSVLAIRANRTSQPSEPSCLPALETTALALQPTECDTGTCTVLVDAAGLGTTTVRVIDAFGAAVDEITVVDRADESWDLVLTDSEPGRYLVVVTNENGAAFGVILTVRGT